MKNLAIYPGSFDPVTNGHVDIIERALKIFDNVIVLVAYSSQKNALFDEIERVAILRKVLKNHNRVIIDSFDGLLMDYVKEKKASAIIRGLRAVSDFEFEFQMAIMNRHINPDVEVLFMMTGEKNFYLSSSMIKEVARLGGPIKNFVPPVVATELKKKLKGK